MGPVSRPNITPMYLIHIYLFQVLPKVAAEVSGPLSECNKITMVSDGSGPIGASKVTGEVLEIMSSLPTMVKGMTGVDITARMAGV